MITEQPFVVISITNTQKMTGDRRNGDEERHWGNRRTREKGRGVV
jgi:hypothetical protein